MQALQEKLAALQTKNQELEESTATLGSMFSEVKEQLSAEQQAHQGTRLASEEKSVHAAAQVTELAREVARGQEHAQAAAAAQQLVLDLRGQLDAEQYAHERAQQQLDSLQGLHGAVLQKLAASEESTAEVSMQLGQQHDESKGLQRELEVLRAEAEALAVQLSASHAEVAALSQAHQELLAAEAKQALELKHMMAGAEVVAGSLAAEQACSSELRLKLEVEAKERATVEQQAETLSLQVQAMQEEVRCADKAVAGLQEQLASSSSEYAVTLADLSTTLDRVRQQHDERGSLIAELEEAKARAERGLAETSITVTPLRTV